MAGSLMVTVFPVVFLTLLFGGGTLLRRKNIDMDGEPLIGRGIFYASKEKRGQTHFRRVELWWMGPQDFRGQLTYLGVELSGMAREQAHTMGP